MVFRVITIACLALSSGAGAWDVSFSDTKYQINTRLLGKNLTDLSFHLCLSAPRVLDRDCIRLSTCVYPDSDIFLAVEKIEDTELRKEMELAVQASIHTKIASAKYIAAFLGLLEKIDTEKKCAIVQSVDLSLKEENTISAKIRFPAKPKGP